MQSDANLIAQTCKQTPYYDLCVRSLNSDPRSPSADVRGLALIMVDIVKARSTTTLNLIKQLLRKMPKLKIPLTDCAADYNAILTSSIPQAIEALKKGNAKFAEDGANSARQEAELCEANFHGKSPITKFSAAVRKSSAIAAAIIRLLL